MSKTRNTKKTDSVIAKIARAGKKSVLRSKMNQRDKQDFRAHALRDLVAGVEYI